MHQHTYESLVELHFQKSGHADHPLNSHDLDCIARLQDDLGQPVLSLPDDSGILIWPTLAV